MRLFSTSARASFPVAVVAAFACGMAPLLAQTKDDGEIWTALVLQGKLGAKDTPLERWRLWLDVHDRQRDDGARLETNIVRPGIGYALTDRVTVHVGYAAVWSDARRSDTQREDRVWQQVVWMIPAGDLAVQSRTRLEERFNETDGDTGWRLRQMFKTTVPLSSDKRTFVSAWDELFWDLNDTDWGQRAGFRQNRAFLGLGRFLDEGKHFGVEVGYLNQWIDKPVEDRLNHCLSIWLFVNF